MKQKRYKGFHKDIKQMKKIANKCSSMATQYSMLSMINKLEKKR